MKTKSSSSNRHLLIASVAIAVLTGIMAIYAHSLSRFPGDLSLSLIFQSVQSDLVLAVVKWISYIAEGWRQGLLIAATSVVFWWRIGRRQAVLILAAELTNLLVPVMKMAVNRPRPSAELIQVLEFKDNASFPSGHAFFAIVVLGLLAYFAFTYIRKPGLKMTIGISLIILILLVGASRVYLGAHWPSDVLGGYGAGAVFLMIFVWIDKDRRNSGKTLERAE